MSRTCCGSAFQSLGPAMLNALLPATVDRVNGTHSRLCSRECRLLDGPYGRNSSCRYAGVVLCIVLYPVITTLKCDILEAQDERPVFHDFVSSSCLICEFSKISHGSGSRSER